MWFTRVSLHNPVFATMMMVALMVLAAVSLLLIGRMRKRATIARTRYAD